MVPFTISLSFGYAFCCSQWRRKEHYHCYKIKEAGCYPGCGRPHPAGAEERLCVPLHRDEDAERNTERTPTDVAAGSRAVPQPLRGVPLPGGVHERG